MSFLGLLDRKILNESASVENVTKAMDNRSKVIINYHSDGKDVATGSRVIEPVAYGLSKSGNPVIRAYQPYGDTTTRTPGWKLFRLDRISYWEETSSKFGDMPDFDMSELNQDGDDTMSVVIKTYRNGQPSAVNSINVGPKTKEKVAASTYGDKQAELGRRNLERMKNCIKIDLSNNRKVANGFNIYTNNTRTIGNGPKFADQSYNPENNRSGSVENGDISQKELDKARAQVYGDYSHELDNDEYDEMASQNKPEDVDKYQNVKDRRWNNSADSRFLNRKGSMNRYLYDLDKKDDEE